MLQSPTHSLRAIQILRNPFSWKLDTSSPRCNANTVGPYTFVRLICTNTLLIHTALRNTLMATNNNFTCCSHHYLRTTSTTCLWQSHRGVNNFTLGPIHFTLREDLINRMFRASQNLPHISTVIDGVFFELVNFLS